jgi:FKBP-type peptidyl-prolyl cis-trans isomerase FkpA
MWQRSRLHVRPRSSIREELPMRRPTYWLAILAILALAGCQQGTSTESAPPSTPEAAEQSSESAAQEAPEAEEVTTRSGLKYQDLVVGDGSLAERGMTAMVNYTGWLTDGTKFDSSLDPGRQPLAFTIGRGMVIRGWEEGVQGMRVGGKRRLTIPPDLAYGERGFPGAIPPNSTLVFEVELLDVRQPE